MRVRLVLGLLILSASASSAVAQSGNAGDERDAAAHELFRFGTEAFEAGDFEDALARYTASYDLSHRPALIYNIALCHDRLDHLEEAIGAYERFVESLPNSPRIEQARTRIHVLRQARADELAGEEDSDADGESGASTGEIGAAVSFGIAGAGLVTWAIAGVLTVTRFDTAEAYCREHDGCDLAELDQVDQTALIADMALGVAVAGTVAGVILLLLDSDDPEAIQVSPSASTQHLGLIARGRF